MAEFVQPSYAMAAPGALVSALVNVDQVALAQVTASEVSEQPEKPKKALNAFVGFRCKSRPRRSLYFCRDIDNLQATTFTSRSSKLGR